MHKKRSSSRPGPRSSKAAVTRRDAMKGLGALALYAPLGTAACGADSKSDLHGGAGGAVGSGAASGAPNGAGPLGAGGAGAATGAGGAASPGSVGTSQGAGGTNPVAGGGGASPSGSGGAATSGVAGGAAAGGGPGGVSGAPGAGGSAGDAGSPIFTPPSFDNVASCTLTTTDIEGPFFIDDNEVMNDESLFRSDVREGLPGCEFRLGFRLLDAKAMCAPIPGAEMYIWHCNASGLYSGFNGQDPSKPYSGPADPSPQNLDRFCRGVQVSDASGIVSFITMYPGWYTGRPIHLHLVARMKGTTTRMITTQLYFPAAFTTEVHESEPAYMARAAAMPAGSRNPPAGKPAMPTLKHNPGLVVGTLNVIVNHS